MTIEEFKRDQVSQALMKTGSVYPAAKLLGCTPNTIYTWLEKYGFYAKYGKISTAKIAAQLRMENR